MWIYMKNEGFLFDPERDQLFIEPFSEDDVEINFTLREDETANFVCSRKYAELFVTQFKEALIRKDVLWIFPDAPTKMTMSLKDKPHEKPADTTVGVDFAGYGMGNLQDDEDGS